MFYKGVIEDNKDPLKLGRVRVRILGIHTHQKKKSGLVGIPTDELPWANPAWPITSSANSGVGNWAIPSQGTWVWIFFEDDEKQRPVYMATISGVPNLAPNKNVGFNDPDEEYPLCRNLKKPDINRLTTNREIDETIISKKVDEIVQNIAVADLVIMGKSISTFQKPQSQNIKWAEPQEPYATVYPYNHVTETEPKDFISGHIIELDDTPGKERIHMYHKSGSFVSIHWCGQIVEKSISDKYDITMGNSFEYVHNSKTTTIWGDQRILVRNHRQTQVFGYDREYVKGSKVNYVSGDLSWWIGADLVDNPSDPNYEKFARRLDGSDADSIDDFNHDNISSVSGFFNLLIENCWDTRIKGNKKEVVDGTYFVEVTGARNISQHKVGSPGTYVLEPHGEFVVRAHKTSRIWGCRMVIDSGMVTGLHVCPLLGAPHLFKSRTAKGSI